jgi:hypothetical protein
MSPRFQYIGSRGEHIVGLPAGDLSAEDYDALDYEHQQAVYLNRGSDGGPLYTEVHEAPVVAPADEVPVDPEPVAEPPAQPDLNQPLDEPAEGAN